MRCEDMVVIAKCDFADARLAAVNANETEAVRQHDHAVFAVLDFMKSVSHGSNRCEFGQDGFEYWLSPEEPVSGSIP